MNSIAPIIDQDSSAFLQARKIFPVYTIEQPKPVRFGQVAFVSIVQNHGLLYNGFYREFTPSKSDRETRITCRLLGPIFCDDKPWYIRASMVYPHGEDPRAFTFNGVPHCSLIDYRGDDFHNIVANSFTGQLFEIEHRLPFGGKNWVPVPHHDGLYFIRSLQPLCILEIDSDWKAKQISPIPITHSRQIGEYRGGAAAKLIDGKIQGYGHRTQENPLRHTPFAYEIDLASMSVQFQDLEPIGFGDDMVIDPTSVIPGGVICSCAAKSWWNEQVITTKLCKVE